MEQSESMPAWLESDDGFKVPLLAYCRLGRAADNHVVIDAEKASRYHAAIHAQDGSDYWLLDLGSRNGTFLDDHRVMRPTPLRDGARIALAGATFHFRQPHVDSREKSEDGPPPTVTITEFKHQKAWLLMTDIESFVRLSQDLPSETLAVAVGRWIQEGQRLVEKWEGRLSKYLGDGFLACWEPAGSGAPSVVAALRDFHHLRETGDVKFRVVLHLGTVTFGGATDFGEETIFGPELNYTFRLETLASELGVKFCLSAAAQKELAASFSTKLVAGEHELKGFPGFHRCFEIDWDNDGRISEERK
jgi:adenylate cyclase